MKKTMFIGATITLFLFLTVRVQISNAQSTNLFSDEPCIKTNNIQDCYPVIDWSHSYSDTIYLTTKDSVIAIVDLPGKNVFFLNYHYRSGFIGLELICNNEKEAIEYLPLMESRIIGGLWSEVFINQQRRCQERFGSGVTEKNELTPLWFKLNSKRADKSLIILIIQSDEMEPQDGSPMDKNCTGSKVVN